MAKELMDKYDGEFDVSSTYERIYNKNDIYKKYLKDMVEEMRYICDMNHIPFFATFAVANDDKKTTYISEAVATGSRDYDLTENRINKHLLINSGFLVEPPALAVPLSKTELDYIAEGAGE